MFPPLIHEGGGEVSYSGAAAHVSLVGDSRVFLRVASFGSRRSSFFICVIDVPSTMSTFFIPMNVTLWIREPAALLAMRSTAVF